MLAAAQGGVVEMLGTAIIDPAAVAEVAVAGIEAETFLTHPRREVAKIFECKASDYEKSLNGMRKLQCAVGEGDPTAGLDRLIRAYRKELRLRYELRPICTPQVPL